MTRYDRVFLLLLDDFADELRSLSLSLRRFFFVRRLDFFRLFAFRLQLPDKRFYILLTRRPAYWLILKLYDRLFMVLLVFLELCFYSVEVLCYLRRHVWRRLRLFT